MPYACLLILCIVTERCTKASWPMTGPLPRVPLCCWPFRGCAFASMSESLFCQGSAAVNGVGYAWLPTGSVRSDAIVVLLDSNTILDLWYPTNITEYLVLPLTHTNNHLLVVCNKTICLAGRFLEFPLSNAVASRLTPTTMTLTKSHYCYDLQNNH